MPSFNPADKNQQDTPRKPSAAGMPTNIGKPKTETAPAAPAKKPIDVIAQEVIRGNFGNGADRKAKIETAGYDFNAVQAEVNRILSGKPAPAANLETIAKAVIRGDYGNGADRKAKVEAAGYDYNAVQAEVNRILSGKPAPAADLDAIARAVIRGDYGNGADRKARVEAAGYDYNAVQVRVNQLLK